MLKFMMADKAATKKSVYLKDEEPEPVEKKRVSKAKEKQAVNKQAS